MPVEIFAGVRVKCMQDYVKLFLRENPHRLIIHAGTNNISTNKQLEQTPKSTVEPALSVKNNICDKTLSNLMRCDMILFLSKKSCIHKLALEGVMYRKEYFLILNGKTITARHLNILNLHLDSTGSEIFRNISETKLDKCFPIGQFDI